MCWPTNIYWSKPHLLQLKQKRIFLLLQFHDCWLNHHIDKFNPTFSLNYQSPPFFDDWITISAGKIPYFALLKLRLGLTGACCPPAEGTPALGCCEGLENGEWEISKRPNHPKIKNGLWVRHSKEPSYIWLPTLSTYLPNQTNQEPANNQPLHTGDKPPSRATAEAVSGFIYIYIREPNQQGFQRSRAMGGETHFFHPSTTDTKQETAVVCESICPVVMADAHL